MKEVKLNRSFTYNGITLACPSAALTTDQVREFYATQYPELNNAVVEGPVTKNNVSAYKFVRAAGDKGRGTGDLSVRESVVQLAAGKALKSMSLAPLPSAEQSPDLKRMLNSMQNVTSSKKAGRAMHLPSSSFGIWG